MFKRKGGQRGIINMDTLMPISLISTIFGGAIWVGNIASNVAMNTRDIEYVREQRQKFDIVLSERLDQNQRDMSEIKSSVSAIDAKIEVLMNRR